MTQQDKSINSEAFAAAFNAWKDAEGQWEADRLAAALRAYEAAKPGTLPQDRAERIAEAIWNSGDGMTPYAEMSDSWRDIARKQAQAALAAMPEPVEVSEDEFLAVYLRTVSNAELGDHAYLLRALRAAGYRITKGEA